MKFFLETILRYLQRMIKNIENIFWQIQLSKYIFVKTMLIYLFEIFIYLIYLKTKQNSNNKPPPAAPVWQNLFSKTPKSQFSHSTGYFYKDMICSSYREWALLHSICI